MRYKFIVIFLVILVIVGPGLINQATTEQAAVVARFIGQSRMPVVARFIGQTISDWFCPFAYAADKGAAPVAHWRFDEGGGPTAYDDSANNSDGTMTPQAGGTNTAAGQMWTRQGKIGSAAEFDGTDDYASAPRNGLTLTSGTISMWFKRNDAQRDFLWATGSDGGAKDMDLIIDNSHRYYFRVFDDASTQYNVNWQIPSLSYSEWYFVTATWDASGVIKLYHNGSFVNQTTSVTYPTSFPNTTQRIGASFSGSYFDGLIDDVRIYDYARDANQIMVDYNAGAASYLGAGTDPNEGNPPVGYWPLDENTGTNAYDRSGNNNNGTITGATFAAGKYGSALSFNGTSDYVDCGSTSIFNNITEITVEAWVYTTSGPINTWEGVVDINGTDTLLSLRANYGTNGNNFSWRVQKTGETTLYGTVPRIRDQWVHLAATFNSGASKLYVNGVLAKEETFGSSTVGDSSMTINLGRSAGKYHKGLIDEVKVYGYARTQAQIAYDYNKGKPVAHYKFDEGTGPIALNDYCAAGSGGNDPVGWWRMDEGTGGTTADESGNGNTGTLYPVTAGTNTTTAQMWDQDGKIGPDALEFDGTDDYVEAGGGGANSGGELTISGWVNPSNFATTQTFMGYGGVNDWLNIRVATNSKLQVWDDIDNTNAAINGSTTLSAGTWYLVTLSVYSDGTKKLYLNGKLETSNTATSTVASDIGTDTVNIGRRNYATTPEQFTGLVDDVRIYDYARTAEQIYNDYKNTHGTMVGDTKFVDGKLGKALEFDGTGDYVLVPDDSALDMGNMTIAAWIKTGISTEQYISERNNATYYFATGVSSGKLCYYINSVAASWDYSNKTVTDNTWHYVVGTWDGTNKKLYIDGSLDKTIAGSGGNIGNVAVGINIGCRNNGGGPTGYFNGLIDDFRLYNYARTAGQVMQDYNAGLDMHAGVQTGVADPWGGALPVGHWKLDENTGVLARDASENTNDGTLTNNPTWTQGKVGPCLEWDDTNKYIALANATAIGSTSWTITAWLNIPSNATDRVGNIIGNYNDSPNMNLEVHSSGQLRIYWNGGEKNEYGTTNLKDDNWHHVTFIRDKSAGKFYMYIDTILEKEITGAGTDVTFSTPFWIGSDKRVGGLPWEGKIDDVKIYNYARTPAQIAWDYNRGKPVAHYRFDEATSGAVPTTAGAIKDDSVHDNDGTASNTTWTYTTGKYGGALNFDGNDYIDVSNPSELNNNLTQVTMSCWVNTSVSGYHHILSRGISWSSGNVILYTDGSTDFRFTVYGYSAAALSGVSPDGNWHHLVGIYDGTQSSNNMKIYVDGILKGTGAADLGTLPNRTDSFRIGTRENTTEQLTGVVDDVRIYNYVRTADQIMQDYNQGLAAKLSD